VLAGLHDYFEQTILLDPAETSFSVMKAAKRQVIRETSPVPTMKIMKNETEICGYRAAMLRDGIAMVRFLKWLDEEMANAPAAMESRQTECSIDRKLTALRAEQPRYRDLSFDTIAGYAEHGAIVHYEATPESDKSLRPEGLLLLDSGAQYQDGTTDITRTIALGPITDEQRHVYTLVLKGHIALSRAVFPDGTAGTQLDVLARQFMWREGLNYLHGTGHGVGSYLSVHEGPHQFRMEWKPQPLRAGMTVTVEPGIYLTGRFGVRVENTMLIVPASDEGFFPLGEGEQRVPYLRLEPLTLCPIDKRPIDLSMLTDDECQWLNDYHQAVYDRLAPHLDAEETAWLREATSPIALSSANL
jgi:Xaa-Pro aminopeptidase